MKEGRKGCVKEGEEVEMKEGGKEGGKGWKDRMDRKGGKKG
mgnify:CR=1 FL=1